MGASRLNLRRTAAVPLALAACALIAACGGGGHKKNTAAATTPKLTPTALVSKAFDASDAVDSGKLALSATINLNGVEQLDGKPIVLALSGPFQRSGGKTSADLAATVTIGSSTAHLAIDELPGHTYLGINGTFYNLPTGSGSPLGALGGSATPSTGSTGLFSSLGIDPHTWLQNPKIVGDATIGGVQTQHLSAQVNIAKVLGDVGKVIGAEGATGASGASSITSALPLVESAINSAKVDIYTGVADNILRRFDLTLSFTVPSIAASEFGGLKGGSLDFDVTLTELGKAQTITAPTDVQPASKLLNGIFSLESQFGSLASLFSSGGGASSLGSLFSGGSRGG
jgi:hypothetical protein